MRVIITEKPSVNNMLAQVVGGIYPNEEIFFIEAQPFWLNNFRFPKGLSLNEYPFYGQPAYKREQPWGTLVRRLSTHKDGLAIRGEAISLDTAKSVMLRADEIICACDWDHTGIWGFDLFIEQTLGPERASTYPVLVLSGGLDNNSVRRAFKSLITTDHESYQALLSAGKAKRLFEYNYAINSLAILGNLYRKLSSRKEPVFISKYTLQLLIWLSTNSPMAPWKIMSYMVDDWMGTGKYSKKDVRHLYGMGSAASRSSILQDLIKLGLAEETAKQKMQITSLGQAFVDDLHPDCSDVNLQFRIDAWMCQGVEAAEPAIRRYLNTFFGKQLRYKSKAR